MKTILAISMLLAAVGFAATPQVGEPAPDFALNTLDGQRVELQRLLADRPAVLVVLRGFPGYQCPLCTRQVNEFVGHAKEFAAKGARVVMVYPGPAMGLQTHAEEFLRGKDWPAEFVFLLDPEFAFTNAYGLRWNAKNETAYPSTLLIARDGKVSFAKVSKTHGGRTTAAEVLKALEASSLDAPKS